MQIYKNIKFPGVDDVAKAWLGFTLQLEILISLVANRT